MRLSRASLLLLLLLAVMVLSYLAAEVYGLEDARELATKTHKKAKKKKKELGKKKKKKKHHHHPKPPPITKTTEPAPGPPRSITVINNCGRDVVLGVTGGNLNQDCKSDADCQAFRIQSRPTTWQNTSLLQCSSVINATNATCYFSFEKNRVPLKTNSSYTFQLPTQTLNVTGLTSTGSRVSNGPVIWSGNLWVSTGCDPNNPNSNCHTGVCGGSTTCGGVNGPTDPVTLAEFTFLQSLDYYDISIIPGANIPIEMRPIITRSVALSGTYADGLSSVAQMYWCSNPGGAKSISGLGSATWEFNPAVIIAAGNPFPKTITQYAPFVTRLDSQGATPGRSCKSSKDCPKGQSCGFFIVYGSDGKPTGAVKARVCGKKIPAGYITWNGACATAGAFANITTGLTGMAPYSCQQAVPGRNLSATFSNMHLCDSLVTGQVPLPNTLRSSPKQCSVPPPTPPPVPPVPPGYPPSCFSNTTLFAKCLNIGMGAGNSVCYPGLPNDPANTTCCSDTGGGGVGFPPCNPGAQRCTCDGIAPVTYPACNATYGAACLNSTSSCYGGSQICCSGNLGAAPCSPGEGETCTCSFTPPPESGFPESPYQPFQNPLSVCGCPNWGALAPATGPCLNCNSNWEYYEFPVLKMMKTAVPTAYTFPYDDFTSTFTCSDVGTAGETNPPTIKTINSVSYVIELCPVVPSWMK